MDGNFAFRKRTAGSAIPKALKSLRINPKVMVYFPEPYRNGSSKMTLETEAALINVTHSSFKLYDHIGLDLDYGVTATAAYEVGGHPVSSSCLLPQFALGTHLLLAFK